LDFFGNLFQISSQERKKRIEQLLEMVGLAGVWNRPVGEFSKGMQRRIGLAQALINDPDLVILDEPTSGLDPIGCREMKDLILALAKRGKTIILSSHLLADVEDVCDRVVIYYGGRIQAMGPLKELLSNRDAIRITAPVLPKETLKKVIEIIRQDVSEDKIKIDNPTQNLESYFLEVVRKAKQQALETSGATSENVIAAYLRGEAETSPQEKTEKLLERLTYKPETPKVEVEKKPEQEVKVDESKLAALTTATTKQEPQQTAPPPQPEPEVDLKKADEKLSDFLNKPK
ncbi:MAG TPA: ABC transporter ATP-binding protein, partial [Verrucomicrobiota bacterium]|nr:ABC transporter ATP-binding protein [Verrucomicrobiota bacterium]